MTEKAGLTRQDLGLAPNDDLVVDLAIVPDHVHTMFGNCAHCESDSEAELITYIHETHADLETMMVLMGDIQKCVDCRGLSLVVEFPKIDHDDVIMTRWTIPEHLRAGM